MALPAGQRLPALPQTLTFFSHGVTFLSSQGHISQSPLCPGVATWLVLINGCHVSKSDSEAGASLLASLILPGCCHLRQPWECHTLQMEEPLWPWVGGWLCVAKAPRHPPSHHCWGASRIQASTGCRKWGVSVPAGSAIIINIAVRPFKLFFDHLIVYSF